MIFYRYQSSDHTNCYFVVFKKILPGMSEPGPDATRWMGRRPGTPDSLPVIRLPGT